MTIPILTFVHSEWLIIPADTVVLLELIASPPVAASVGIIVFSRHGQQSPWAQTGTTTIDNYPDSIPGPTFQTIVRTGMEYIIRFQGEAHLLMPVFSDISIGFNLSTPIN